MSGYVNIGMRPIPGLPLDIGSIPTSADRGKWDVKNNETPSIRDGLFAEERESHISVAKTKKEADSAITIHISSPNHKKVEECAREILHIKALEDHMEERIAAFLVQIIDCFDTDFYYTIGKTQDQTKSTSAVRYEFGRGVPKLKDEKTLIKLASAHHGTLPCIYAYPRANWEAWKMQGNPQATGKPEAKVHLSDPYYVNNACTGLPAVDNQADIDLDGNATERSVEFGQQKPKNEEKLREFAIALLNRAARREVTPVQGLVLFIKKMQQLLNQLDALNLGGEKKLIFSTWKRVVEGFDAEYRDRYQLFIARMLHLRIPNCDRDTINLEEVVYPRHYKIIQKKNCYQTTLISKIDELKKAILQQDKTPRNLDKAFKLALMKEASRQDEDIRMIFQRFYNLSGDSIVSLQNECNRVGRAALELVNTEDSKRHIRNFFHKFSQYMHNFGIDRTKFSAGLTKELRIIQGLSLRAFADKYNQKFPNDPPLNYEQLRRIEEGRVELSPRKIRHIAKTLGVDKSLLQANF